MSATQLNFQNLIRQARAELAANPRKALLLLAAALVACWAVGRLLIKDSVPASAGARMLATPAPTAEEGTLAGKLLASPDKARAATELLLSAERRRLDRDIFAPNTDYFPPQDTAANVKTVSTVEADDTEAAARLQAQVVQAQAQSLALQSTMLSDNPTAMINGQVLYVGDWVNEFEVVRITAHSCTVRKDDVSIILEMAAMGGG